MECDCKCFHSIFPQFRLQGDNLAERPEDVSMISQTSEPAVSDSEGKLYKYLLLIKKKKISRNTNILHLRVEVMPVKED